MQNLLDGSLEDFLKRRSMAGRGLSGAPIQRLGPRSLGAVAPAWTRGQRGVRCQGGSPSSVLMVIRTAGPGGKGAQDRAGRRAGFGGLEHTRHLGFKRTHLDVKPETSRSGGRASAGYMWVRSWKNLDCRRRRGEAATPSHALRPLSGTASSGVRCHASKHVADRYPLIGM
ncbi:hypothetical protein JX266_003905 [Neoarthrinium moseri]|nr:hypothetical protein JX266_003905 [Neoarthrinium moseri]